MLIKINHTLHVMSQIENCGDAMRKQIFTIAIKSSLSPAGYCLAQQ